MRAKDQTPSMRLLAIAALLLAAGLLSLRAYGLFGTPKSEAVGSTVERELTYLLEPITGADNVRVSVTGRTDRTVLVMINGEMASDLRPLRTQIENVLAAAIGFDAATDTLTLTQFPFARGVGGSLKPIEMAELTGLGLLCGLLLIGLLSPRRDTLAVPERIQAAPQDPDLPAPSRLAPPAPDMDTELQAASRLAESKPNETARLVRSWMSYAEE